MNLTIDVRGVPEVKAALNRLSEAAQGRAMAQALKRTADKGRTEIGRAVRADYNISADLVRSSISSSRLGSFERGTLSAVIAIYGTSSRRGRSANVIRYLEKSITLAEAKRRRKAGTLTAGNAARQFPVLRFKFKKGGGSKTIEGAFIGNRGRTVFRRVGPGRLPLEAIRIIDLPQMFTASKIQSRVLERINRELVAEAERAVRFAIQRGAA